MSKLGFVFVTAVLALATLLPMATSAGRSGAPVAPSPTEVGEVPATPSVGEGIACLDLSTVDAAAASNGVFGLEGSGPPDLQAMEQLRQELLGLVDSLEALSRMLPDPVLAQDVQESLAQSRQFFRQLTPEQLQQIQGALAVADTDVDTVKTGIEFARTTLLTADGQVDGQKQGPGLAPDSFPSFPTPTPGAPGVQHDGSKQSDLNEQLGDLFSPGWPTDVGCPKMGYSTEVMFGMMISLDALNLANIIIQANCKEKTVACPPGNPKDPVDCFVAAGFQDFVNIAGQVRDGFAYCNGNVASARIQAIYEDTKILHAELDEHDRNLTTRLNAADKFLFDFRNLNLRLNIEANLASPVDNPHALLALPRAVCVSSDLEALQRTDPFAPEVIAGCGLLEVVSDTVRSAIDMIKVANGPASVNNAEAEFQAAVDHFQNSRWKQAYDRFRKAYREAVKP